MAGVPGKKATHPNDESPTVKKTGSRDGDAQKNERKPKTVSMDPRLPGFVLEDAEIPNWHQWSSRAPDPQVTAAGGSLSGQPETAGSVYVHMIISKLLH